MGIRAVVGRRLEATVGADRTDRLRATERGLRSRVAGAIAPAPVEVVPPKPPPAEKRRAGNPLRRYFRTNQGRMINKWQHYFDIYHRHFERFRDRPVTIVEFGVASGGSLQMWKHYFGPQARIIGIDINPACADLAEPQVEILIGDQEDPAFLREVARVAGPIDVLIEDGGHRMGQQLSTFAELWPSIADDGVFLIEDLHTSYWEKYGGGYLREGTFIEFAKTLVDQQHAWHSRDERLSVDAYTTSIRGMHVYDSVIVFDKALVPKPQQRRRGKA